MQGFNCSFKCLANRIFLQHVGIFPKATIETQMEKLSEEIYELSKASTVKDIEEEHGDVLYVIISLFRFPSIYELASYLLFRFYDSEPPKKKAKLRKILAKTADKVEARHNKGAYYWNGSKYERNKTL